MSTQCTVSSRDLNIFQFEQFPIPTHLLNKLCLSVLIQAYISNANKWLHDDATQSVTLALPAVNITFFSLIFFAYFLEVSPHYGFQESEK